MAKDIKNYLTPNENMIRRIWALLTVVQTICILTLYVQNLMKAEMQTLSTNIILVSALFLLVIQYLIFHFVFLKHGTKLLTVLLFWMPISCIFSLVSGYKAGLMNYAMIGLWALTAVWYVLLWKMRKINHRINAQVA